MSESENDSYTSDHDENIEKPIEFTGFKESTQGKPENHTEQDSPVKPKRVMSEKQLENLRKARLIAHAKLKDKKKESQLMKKKEQELKILKKLEKNITVDKKIKDLKNKITVDKDDDIIYKAKPKTKKKKIVYVSDTESEEEILYLKKPRARAQPNGQALQKQNLQDSKNPYRASLKTRKPQHQFIEDLDEHDKREKEAQNKIVESQYNDKIAQIKREFLLRSVFQP